METISTLSQHKHTSNSNIVQVNPKSSDHFLVKQFHHIEFWCSDSTNVSRRFSWGLGMPIIAKSDLSTGNSVHASYLLRTRDLCFLFTSSYNPCLASISSATIPSFNSSLHNSFITMHGLGVRAIAIEVEDADLAFRVSVSNGAVPSCAPMCLQNGIILAEVLLCGDVVLRYISYKTSVAKRREYNDVTPSEWFLPGFKDMPEESSSRDLDMGIQRLDHVAINVPELRLAFDYVKNFTGFHHLVEYTTDEIGSSESGLNTVVLASNDEMVLMTLAEPVHGTRRKSQIQTYLEHNPGCGVQHLALMSGDIFWTLKEMSQRSGFGGFEFAPPPPPTYYKNLKNRARDVLSEEQMKQCEEFGVLVDKDDQGTLLQIFTKPIGDRPTIFLEIIQRIGCLMKNEDGELYQKGGCGGFGKGNISELFKSIEEYVKTLAL